MPKPMPWIHGSGVCREEVLGGRYSFKSSEMFKLLVSLKAFTEQTGETKCGESKLVGSESSTGDTMAGLLGTDARGSLL